MNFRTILMTIFFAAFVHLGMVEGAKDECAEICTMDYTPVCGKIGEARKTFPNRCSLDYHACKARVSGGPDVVFERVGAC